MIVLAVRYICLTHLTELTLAECNLHPSETNAAQALEDVKNHLQQNPTHVVVQRFVLGEVPDG